VLSNHTNDLSGSLLLVRIITVKAQRLSFAKTFEPKFPLTSLFVKASQLPNSGNGLFTKIEIRKGDRIVEYKGKIRLWREVKHLDGYNGYLLRLSRTLAIDAEPTIKAKGRYANDARGLVRVKGLMNNAAYLIYGNQCFIEATKSISPGEEIFVSYGKEFWTLQRKLRSKGKK
jgi:SET domain-containing protein